MSRTEDVFGLSAEEFSERARLREYQRCTTRWFSQEEFDRLAELSERMYEHQVAQCYEKAICPKIEEHV
jgi:hypothetical protein